MRISRGSVFISILIQLCLAGLILKDLDILPYPPVRLTMVVGGQLLLIALVSRWSDISGMLLRRYVGLLAMLYLCALWITYGLRPRVAGRFTVQTVDPLVRTEALVSIALLLGFALLNMILFVRLLRRQDSK